MTRPPTPAEIADAAALLPGPDWGGGHVEEGGDDHLVLVPGDAVPTAVLRTARRPDVASCLPARVRLVEALAPQLPYALPVALTEVVVGERTGLTCVGQVFLPGAQHPPHGGDPAVLAQLLADLAAVPDAAWSGIGAASEQVRTWDQRLDTAQRELVLGALPETTRPQAVAIWNALDAVGDVQHGLVHGDLAGDNLRWQEATLTGILDWDQAGPGDPAINLAQLGLWHGLDVIGPAAPNPRVAARARLWLGHLALLRVHDAAARRASGVTVRRFSRLLGKTLPRLDIAAAAAETL